MMQSAGVLVTLNLDADVLGRSLGRLHYLSHACSGSAVAAIVLLCIAEGIR
jgi:hypothetical protein